jgi:Fibronectin type III domain
MLHRVFLALMLLAAPAMAATPPAAPPVSPAAPALTPAQEAAHAAWLKDKAERAAWLKRDPLGYWCERSRSPNATNGTSKLAAALANNISWQPQDGHVQFTIQSTDGVSPSQLANMEIRVCFGWPQVVSKSADNEQTPTQYRSTYVQTIKRDNESATYETTMPEKLWGDTHAPNFGDVLMDVWNGATGRPRHVYDGWGVVPILDMHIVTRTIGMTDTVNDPNAMDVILPVGLSFRAIALGITFLLVALAWWMLLRWARHRGVSGGWVISIISNRNGYASLSQFQILLWTVVIGAGAIYVMALSGSLIEIPPQALALLGISGFSALSAAIKSQQGGDNPPAAPAQAAAPDAPPPPTKPATVRNLQALSKGSGDVLLFWQPGEGGLPVVAYEVTPVQPAGSPAVARQDADASPFAQVSSLAAHTNYTYSVVAIAAGNVRSDPVSVNFTTEAAAPSDVPRVENLKVSLPNRDNVPQLAWDTSKKADAYFVQYRRAGIALWSTAPDPVSGNVTPVLGNKTTVRGLDYVTPYEFRVIGVKDGRQGDASNIVSITTGTHAPRWSDLVVWDGQHELDITRVQMLVFTVLAAIFVVVKIGDDGAIPNIPDSIILLMGLSNGVYVGGKFIGATR